MSAEERDELDATLARAPERSRIAQGPRMQIPAGAAELMGAMMMRQT